jgi:hypothetical protein
LPRSISVMTRPTWSVVLRAETTVATVSSINPDLFSFSAVSRRLSASALTLLMT